MNVYRDMELVGECSLELSLSDRVLGKVVTARIQNVLAVDDPRRGQNAEIVHDEWEIVSVPGGAIKLRDTDNPEHLPGWKPLPDCPPFRYEAGGITETDDPELLPGWKPLPNQGLPYVTSDLAPIAIEPGSINYEPPRRSLREMAESAAKTFALQVPRVPLSLNRDKFEQYMAGVIEALLLTAARGEYRPAGVPELGLSGYPCGNMEHCHPTPHEALQCERKPIQEIVDEAYQDLAALPEVDEALARGEKVTLRTVIPPDYWREISPDRRTKAGMYRAAGLDPDGEPTPLPKKPEPEERPFAPNKWGEHGDD